MAVDPPFIDSSAGAPAYSGNDLRLGLILPLTAGAGTSLAARSGVRPSGSGTDLLVQAQSSPNMTVKVNPGAILLQGSISSTQGPYGWALDTLTNLTIGASHATLDRTDLICVRVRDANVDTSGARDGSVVVVPGTNGGGVPSLPTDATYYTLAQVFVQHAVTSIVAGAITDKRGFTAALGGVLPFVSTARPTSLMDGQPGWEIDTSYAYTYRAGSLNKWLRNAVTVYKTSDQGTGANNTTFSNVTDFAVPLDANSKYAFDSWVAFEAGATGDVKLQFTLPTGATMTWSTYGPPPSTTTGTDIGQGVLTTAAGPGLWGGSGFVRQVGRIAGTITTSTTAGTAQLQYAQNANDAEATTIYADSWLSHRQMA